MSQPNNDSFEPFNSDLLVAATARKLDELGYPYMLIGGFAVVLHGHNRFTQDADFELGVMPSEAERLATELNALELLPSVTEAIELASEAMILPLRHRPTNFGIDLSFVPSLYFEDAMSRRIEKEVAGYPVGVVGLEDLIIHKVIAQRNQDAIDAIELMARYPAHDQHLVRQWLREFEALYKQPLVEVFDQWRKEADA